VNHGTAPRFRVGIHSGLLVVGEVGDDRQSSMTVATAMGNQYLGETYLQFVIGEEKPPLSVMLANFSFLPRTLPFAKSKARRYPRQALDGYRALDTPSNVAQCHDNLGLLEKAGKPTEQARECFLQARDIAETVDAAKFVRDAEAAMAKLGAD
jgi:hypothetical protein